MGVFWLVKRGNRGCKYSTLSYFGKPVAVWFDHEVRLIRGLILASLSFAFTIDKYINDLSLCQYDKNKCRKLLNKKTKTAAHRIVRTASQINANATKGFKPAHISIASKRVSGDVMADKIMFRHFNVSANCQRLMNAQHSFNVKNLIITL